MSNRKLPYELVEIHDAVPTTEPKRLLGEPKPHGYTAKAIVEEVDQREVVNGRVILTYRTILAWGPTAEAADLHVRCRLYEMNLIPYEEVST